jgi:hypothetical protein
MRRRQPKLIPVRPSKDDGMLHDTTVEWPPGIHREAGRSSAAMARIMTIAYDETHGGVASGPLG